MINNLFPTPIYSNTIDSDTLKKLQTDINDYIKNKSGVVMTSVVIILDVDKNKLCYSLFRPIRLFWS